MSSSEQFEKVLESLAKNPLQRNGQDIKHIKAHLKTIAFLNSQFQDDDQNFEQLSKLFRLEIFEKGSIIFHIDTAGDKYYLILKGQVEIYARPPKKVQSKEEKLKEKQEKAKAKLKAAQERKAKKSGQTTPRGAAEGNNSTQQQGNNSTSAPPSQMGENKSDEERNNSDSDMEEKKEDSEPEETEEQKALKGLIMVKLLLQGWAFGEMALLYNQPRLASAVAAQRVTLAVLTKHNFTNIMRKAQMKLIQAELDVLRGSYLFSTWEDATLRDIYLNSEMIYIRRDQHVFKQGDEADSIYIIKKGLFQVIYLFTSTSVISYSLLDATQMSKTIKVNQSNDTEVKVNSFSYEGKINQLSERDVFGEEDFVDVIRSAFNMGLSDGDSNRNTINQGMSKQQESTLAMKLQEELKANGRKILRESTVVCKNREGGFVIKIKIYDFLSRVLVFRATRLAALASIEQKRNLHKEIHEKNTSTVSTCHLYFQSADTKKYSRLTPEDSFRCASAQQTRQFLSSSNNHRPTINNNRHHFIQNATLPSTDRDNHQLATKIVIPTVATVAVDAIVKNPLQKQSVGLFVEQQLQFNQQYVKLQPLSPRSHYLQNINVEDEDVILKQLQFDPDSLDYEGEKSARRTHKLKPKPPQPNEKELMTPFKFDTARLERYKIRKRQSKQLDQSSTYHNDYHHQRSHSSNSNSSYPSSPRQSAQSHYGNEVTLSTVIGGVSRGRYHSIQSSSSKNNNSNNCSSHQQEENEHFGSQIKRKLKKLGYSILSQSTERQGGTSPFQNKQLVQKMCHHSNQNKSRIVMTDPRRRREVNPTQIEESKQHLQLGRASTLFEKQEMSSKEVLRFNSQSSTQPTFNENAGISNTTTITQSAAQCPPSFSEAEVLTYAALLSSKPQNEMEYMPRCGFKGQMLRKLPTFESNDIELMNQKAISNFKSIALSRRQSHENSISRKRVLCQINQTGTFDVVSRAALQFQPQLASLNQEKQQQQQLQQYLNSSDIQINPTSNQLITKNTKQTTLKPFLRQSYIHPHIV